MKKLFYSIMMMCGLLAAKPVAVNAAVDPDFHVYICFGQSNMEGNAQWETIDNQFVDSRFQMLATTNFDNPQRTLGNWYTAYCPIVSPMGKLGPSDYFGRTMVAAMPSNVKIGVVAVAMGGSPIEMFDKDKYQAKMQEKNSDGTTPWHVTLATNYYGGNPYGRIIEMAKKAQQSGVIKGILLHQGCSNNGDPNWPNEVKKIYNDMLTDLGLNAADVPLFVGETEYQNMGGGCYGHNAVVAQIPSVIPTGHVVSAEGLPGNGVDAWHFSPAGYRTLGKRYAYEALKVMSLPTQKNAAYTLPDNLVNFYTTTGLKQIDDLVIRVNASRTVTVNALFADGHQEIVTREAQFQLPDFLTITDGKLTATKEGSGDVTVTYTDFTGKAVSTTFHVEGTLQGNNHILAVDNKTAGTNPWDKQLHAKLSSPMTIGKTYVVKATIKADNGGDCALWPIWTGSPNRDEWNNSTDLLYLSAVKLTSTFQEFTWEFDATWAMDMLQFAFGKIGGMVYFDDISCVEKGTTNDLVVNGSFESDDLSQWEVISWANQTMTTIEDPTTGITTMDRGTKATDNVIYTLDGRRVTNPQKGLYIVNGRKVVIK